MEIIVFLACLTVAACSNVTVSPSSSCSQPCGSIVNGTSIDQALRNITSGDYLRILPGCHCVRTFSAVRDVTDVSLLGDGGGMVRITCARGLGLAFLNVTRLSFQSLTITGCGFNGSYAVTLYNSIKNVNFQALLPTGVNIAMVIASCTDVVMDKVLVTMINAGLGLVGINVAGISNFTNNVFSFQGAYRRVCSASAVRGGATFVYLDYVTNTSDDSVEMNVENCTFANNSYCGLNAFSIQLAYRYRLVNFSAVSPYLIGSGGGFSISLAQQRFSANINVRGCVFERNMVAFGSVASLYWFAGLQDSHVQFTDCTFTGNGLDSANTTGQGCIGLVKDITLPSYASGQVCSLDRPNSLTISRSNFVDNFGSGVSIQSFYATPSSVLDRVVVDNCRFEGNKAAVGPAISAYERKAHGLEEGISLLVQNCSIVNNVATDLRSAVLQVLAMNVTVRDASFLNNIGTALSGDNSVITLGGKVDFINNTALTYGGALRLTSVPFLIVRGSSSISFINNSASLYGGAIYVDYTFGNLEWELNRHDCFLYFESINVFCSAPFQCPVLRDLKVNMIFSKNRAPLGGTFFGVSLNTCPWAAQVNKSGLSDSILERMLEQSFIFQLDQWHNTSDVISTLTIGVDVKKVSNTSSYMPGQQFQLQVRALDFYNHDIQTVVTAETYNNDSQTIMTALTQGGFPPLLGESGYLLTAANSYLNASLRVYGEQNATTNVILSSLDTFASSNSMTITLTECLFGFVYNAATADCQCSTATNLSKVHCDGILKVFNVTSGWWFGPGPNGTGVIYARCPVGYCREDIEVLSPQANQCADNHDGLLCGGCQEGYSAVFGSNRCMECTDSALGLLAAFAAAGIGLIVIISVLHITITDGYTYGIVLYANLNSVYEQYFITLFNGSVTSFIPLQLLNLGLGYGVCFYDGMTPLDRAGLGLVFPAYLFVLMILFIWLASRSLRLSEWLAKSNYTPSKLVATIIVLSYNSITQSCFQILALHEVTVYHEGNSSKVEFLWATDPNVEYFSALHAALFSVAIVLLVTYIIPLPVLLILSSCTSRFVGKMKPLYDAFFSPFKDNRTFWIGVSLLLRVLLSAVFSFVTYYTVQAILDIILIGAILIYVLFEPYKKASQNAMYVFFFANILTLVILSLSLKQYEYEENYPSIRTLFTVLASIVLGSGYVVIALLILWKLYPKAHSMCLAVVHTVRLRRHHSSLSEEGATTPIPTEPLTKAEGTCATKPRPVPPKFSELREPLMDQGYWNIEFKT